MISNRTHVGLAKLEDATWFHLSTQDSASLLYAFQEFFKQFFFHCSAKIDYFSS
jgi:hypothetical protein